MHGMGKGIGQIIEEFSPYPPIPLPPFPRKRGKGGIFLREF